MAIKTIKCIAISTLEQFFCVIIMIKIKGGALQYPLQPFLLMLWTMYTYRLLFLSKKCSDKSNYRVHGNKYKYNYSELIIMYFLF